MEVLFSSNKTEWETPQDFFDELDKEFKFKTDVCATEDNTKCNFWMDGHIDGLVQDWFGRTCWMNPPYNKPEQPCKASCKKQKCEKRGFHLTEYLPGINDWMKKAYKESLKGATVVCLVPSRTDTKWWWNYVEGKAEVRFVKGRLKFGGSKHNAPFPSAVIIYRGKK